MKFDGVFSVARMCRGWDLWKQVECAPTFARPGNGCGGTAGSYVLGSPECGHIALDEVDDVDWSGGVFWCSREGAQVVRQREGMAQLPNRQKRIESG